jgi:hypothetical protein
MEVVVMEQIGFARIKCPEAMRIIVVPRRLTRCWRRHLTQGTNRYQSNDDPSVWNLDSQFEPLLVFFCLPFTSYSSKLSEQRKIVDLLQRIVPKPDMLMLLPTGAQWDLLHKLLYKERGLCPM